MSRLVRDLGTLPNLVTLTRVVLVPLALVALHAQEIAAVFWLLLASAVGDIADGILARRLNQTTDLGAILDRATDMMMESVGLFALAAVDLVPVWVLFVYLFREFLVTSARMYMAQIGAPVPKSVLGQRKTNLLMGGVCVGVALAAPIWPQGVPLPAAPIEIGVIAAVVLGLICSYLSMAKYLAALARSYPGSDA